MRPLFLAVLWMMSCGFVDVVGNGRLQTVERSAAGVSAVTLSTPGDLTIRLGQPPSLTITAEENVLPFLTSDLSGKRLVLGIEPHTSLRTTRAIEYLLTVPSLTAITVSSSGDVLGPVLTATELELAVKSSGSIELAGVEATRVTTLIESSGNVRLRGGTIDEHTITIRSSGDLFAEDVRTRSATISLSSSGDANVWVTDWLDATLTSSGNVRYSGTPRITVHATSSGKLLFTPGR